MTWDLDPTPQSQKLQHGWIDAIRPLAIKYFVLYSRTVTLPIPYLTLKTHYRVVTEVDQEKRRDDAQTDLTQCQTGQRLRMRRVRDPE